MGDEKTWCVIDGLRRLPARQRLADTNALLEQLAEAAKQARDVRDGAIVEMSTTGTGVHELTHLSGMSKSHVQATVRRGIPAQEDHRDQ